MSIADRKVSHPEPGARLLPAILDTGNSHNVAIRREHLDRWAGLKEPGRGRVRMSGQLVPLVPANAWIHPNRPGTREVAGRAPFPLLLEEGLAVFPPEVPNPARLPTLGLRALVRNGLSLFIDGRRRAVTLRTAGWS